MGTPVRRSRCRSTPTHLRNAIARLRSFSEDGSSCRERRQLRSNRLTWFCSPACRVRSHRAAKKDKTQPISAKSSDKPLRGSYRMTYPSLQGDRRARSRWARNRQKRLDTKRSRCGAAATCGRMKIAFSVIGCSVPARPERIRRQSTCPRLAAAARSQMLGQVIALSYQGATVAQPDSSGATSRNILYRGERIGRVTDPGL